MSAIPILTALGDLLGSAFLLFAFELLETLNDKNALIPPNIDNSMTTQAINTTISSFLVNSTNI